MKATTLTFALIATLISTSTSAQSFKIYTSNNLTLEVFSKVEEPVEENLPIITDAVCKSKSPANFVLEILSKEEELVAEELPVTDFCQKQISDEYMVALVRRLEKEEAEVDDLNFDTREVFNQIKDEKNYELTPEDLAGLIKEEKEVMDVILWSSALSMRVLYGK
jgi:hypothetical protein